MFNRTYSRVATAGGPGGPGIPVVSHFMPPSNFGPRSNRRTLAKMRRREAIKAWKARRREASHG